MKKIDYKKDLKNFYSPSVKNVEHVVLPAMNFLMIDGKGDPNTSEEFKAAIETLYPVAYTIKFDFKKNKDIDFGVMPLEGLWWSDNMDDFVLGKKDNWYWTLMIMQPEFVTKQTFEETLVTLKEKKKAIQYEKIRFESYEEGKSVQLMHIGPFADEGPNIMRLHKEIADSGHQISGKHHEIYLSDLRRVDPAKLKTVIRQGYR
ncbi:MAG: GyrI-like domain-containing protein [bacterium]